MRYHEITTPEQARNYISTSMEHLRVILGESTSEAEARKVLHVDATEERGRARRAWSRLVDGHRGGYGHRTVEECEAAYAGAGLVCLALGA